MPPFSFILQVLHLQVSHDVSNQSPPRRKRGFHLVFQPLKALILGHFRDYFLLFSTNLDTRHDNLPFQFHLHKVIQELHLLHIPI